jgi:hypothetical protein
MDTLKRYLPKLFVIMAYVVLGYGFFSFIYSYTFPIPYADEWGIADVALDKIRLQYFFWQNNEHRAGTDILYLQILSHLTHWNMLYETMSIGILILISSLFALKIKQYFLKSVDYWDIIVPFIFLNVTQYENLLWGINICHVFPTFFLLWALYLLTRPDSPWKHHLLIIISLLSAYSSFQGLVVGCVVMFYFIFKVINNLKNKKSWQSYIIYAIGTLAILFSYFVGFDWPPYLGPSRITFLFVVQFIFRQISASIGDYRSSYTMVVLPLAVSLFFLIGIRQWISQRLTVRNYILISLFTYSLLFVLFIAWGRGGYGLEFSTTSRYVTYLSPLFFGCYLIGRLYMKGWLLWIGVGILSWFICISLLYRPVSMRSAELWYTNIENWKKCYLRYENIDQCNTITHFLIYNQDTSEIQERMNGLKAKRLNLYYP